MAQLGGMMLLSTMNQNFGAFVNWLESTIFYSISLNENVSIPLVVVWLMVASIVFTVYFNFINIRGFKHAIDVVRGKYDDPNDTGEVSHFQALTTALSGTVGIGNIAGVALAVSIGGPGATFWMILGGLLGMANKFAECTLAVKYRNVHADGEVSGGPMYYLQKGFAQRGFPIVGKLAAVFFAIACIGGAMGAANMFQINQATQQLVQVTGAENSFFHGNEWVFGLIMATLVGAVIIGGIKSIAKVTDKIVPFMVGVYFLGVMTVLITHIDKVPNALWLIIDGAFNAPAISGGFLGVMVFGFQRAFFSNEAGIGSAAIAHSAAKTDEPVSEGIVALLEPVIDTVVVCTMTALVIIITGEYQTGQTEGVLLTSRAFGSVISWFPSVLSFAVILFALSTIISWSYYGLKAWTFLFGETRQSEMIFKFIFCLTIILGSTVTLGDVFRFSDCMIFSMCIPNVFGLYMFAPELKKDLDAYFAKLKTGEIKEYA
ncbi:alanine/glycine:cation symporter family protein [Aureibacter tunicatorum]|uniref:AGCS family alanine or glycine:cation symporter n=1 Tax=Aureibacter tunicatorum TaxID=866807 RepID=A0AAE4BSE8_9BACT|nr:alanine/glycine:cation symporter family protein [Aureibacter tunicatorum]MDR6238317.1 AGCS family alanine or glycine:cation symporter [Aureibacter tunicatorum]BDD03349.1 alanine glycine permease [Aureibacter tunicatorum]